MSDLGFGGAGRGGNASTKPNPFSLSFSYGVRSIFDVRTGAEVKGASVQAEIVSQYKGDKVIAYKYRRRKGYHRTVGHRRRLTKLKITGIAG